MNKQYNIPTLPLTYDLETKAILKQVNAANKKLAELKGCLVLKKVDTKVNKNE